MLIAIVFHCLIPETGDDDDEDDDLIDDDLRCGYFGWKPDFLQILNTPGFLLAALGFFNACQGQK